MIGLKALAGGSLVVAIALLSDALQPKTFSGLFAAAPSVALVSLGLTALVMGSPKAAMAAHSMVAGAGGMVACCVVVMLAERRVGAVASTALAWLTWAGVAAVIYSLFLQ